MALNNPQSAPLHKMNKEIGKVKKQLQKMTRIELLQQKMYVIIHTFSIVIDQVK